MFVDFSFVCSRVWARIANPRYPLAGYLMHIRAIGVAFWFVGIDQVFYAYRHGLCVVTRSEVLFFNAPQSRPKRRD
jgi:hypothetical protein